ncbi:MAG: type II toxin-antitoxin system RelE/ParE family toxin [Pseudomonadota bacterium]
MKPGKLLTVIYYRTEDTKNYPAKEWLDEIDVEAKFKLKHLLKQLEIRGPLVWMMFKDFFEPLGKGLFQIRLEHGDKWYRLIYFYWDKKAVVCHGYEKETNKIPPNENQTALNRMKDFDNRMKMELLQKLKRPSKKTQ